MRSFDSPNATIFDAGYHSRLEARNRYGDSINTDTNLTFTYIVDYAVAHAHHGNVFFYDGFAKAVVDEHFICSDGYRSDTPGEPDSANLSMSYDLFGDSWSTVSPHAQVGIGGLTHAGHGGDGLRSYMIGGGYEVSTDSVTRYLPSVLGYSPGNDVWTAFPPDFGFSPSASFSGISGPGFVSSGDTAFVYGGVFLFGSGPGYTFIPVDEPRKSIDGLQSWSIGVANADSYSNQWAIALLSDRAFYSPRDRTAGWGNRSRYDYNANVWIAMGPSTPGLGLNLTPFDDGIIEWSSRTVRNYWRIGQNVDVLLGGPSFYPAMSAESYYFTGGASL